MHVFDTTRGLSALALLMGHAVSAQAFSLSTSGNLTYNDDIAEVAFTLTSPSTAVRLWTDSFHNGVNFDPVLTLWKRTGSDYTQVGGADDDSSVGPGQTYFDAGLKVPTLDAGDYLVAITASPYLAVGPLRSQGYAFAYPFVVHTLISQWDQPSSSNHNQKGTFWSLQVATGTVPEPNSAVLLALGLGLVGGLQARQRARAASGLH